MPLINSPFSFRSFRLVYQFRPSHKVFNTGIIPASLLLRFDISKKADISSFQIQRAIFRFRFSDKILLIAGRLKSSIRYFAKRGGVV